MDPCPETAALAALRDGFFSGATLPLAARQAALRRLAEGLVAREDAFLDALHTDLGKPQLEAWTSEILPLRQELAHVRKHLAGWMRRQRVGTGWLHWPARAAVQHAPRGAVLILSPWNYPLQLTLMPLISALAAGNTVLLKPSEFAPATAALLQRLVADCFDPGQVRLLQGDAGLAGRLTALPWDHIFFTGSPATGRRVALAAAATLTSCTLELGGCNPCIVEPSADPRIAARRIVWGKFLNAGQTCIAPNHVLVHASLRDRLVDELRAAMVAFHGADGQRAQRLAHPAQFARVVGRLDQGRILQGGQVDAARLHVAPTLMVDLAADASNLREEIFGPILPVVPWTDADALLRQLQAAPSPLVIHLHGRDDALAQRLQQATRSGALVRNDNVLQAAVSGLPFGGVGPSGQGRAHGQAGFQDFSSLRSHYHQSARLELPFRYPRPGDQLRWLRRIFRRTGL
ncbi:aldehyde dehydrogenase family protein [Roseomonas sp. 18066]|uniref:aldehyde dehydrogenase family protein n=1 Tax=Roseomonas sp. 18066 TaxID=2681412 RepID=UPI001359E5A1|nr:aldehyde dehydrogenase family protein [Roseomonas sp. 18066]